MGRFTARYYLIPGHQQEQLWGSQPVGPYVAAPPPQSPHSIPSSGLAGHGQELPWMCPGLLRTTWVPLPPPSKFLKDFREVLALGFVPKHSPKASLSAAPLPPCARYYHLLLPVFPGALSREEGSQILEVEVTLGLLGWTSWDAGAFGQAGPVPAGSGVPSRVILSGTRVRAPKEAAAQVSVLKSVPAARQRAEEGGHR